MCARKRPVAAILRLTEEAAHFSRALELRLWRRIPRYERIVFGISHTFA
jgi:hypothetical protein